MILLKTVVQNTIQVRNETSLQPNLKGLGYRQNPI